MKKNILRIASPNLSVLEKTTDAFMKNNLNEYQVYKPIHLKLSLKYFPCCYEVKLIKI